MSFLSKTRTGIFATRDRILLLFRIGLWIKGFFALLDILGGIILLAISPLFALVPHWITTLTQTELSEDPTDIIATTLVRGANHLSIGTELFSALYLLIHGVVKIILVTSLWKNKRWAYPWSIGVLGTLVVYQFYRFAHTHSALLLMFSLFDTVVIYLIWREYKDVQKNK